MIGETSHMTSDANCMLVDTVPAYSLDDKNGIKVDTVMSTVDLGIKFTMKINKLSILEAF